MDLVVIGSGRAGGSLIRASESAGHRIVGVVSRRPFDPHPELRWDEPLPVCDLAVFAVSDGAITSVAERLAPLWNPATPAVHLSGFLPVAALAPLAAVGSETGSFHPLQTLPDPERGSQALAGAWAAITADSPLDEVLDDYATSLEMRPFALADGRKPLYHAAASSAANYVVESLAVASDLLAAAGVPAEVIEPLTRRVVDNVFEVGAGAALTGPVARGDIETVSGQMSAARSVSDDLGEEFELLTRATAIRAGTDLDGG